jgi:hypothetical protein
MSLCQGHIVTLGMARDPPFTPKYQAEIGIYSKVTEQMPEGIINNLG